MRRYVFRRPVAPGSRAIGVVEIESRKYGQAVAKLIDLVDSVPAGTFSWSSFPSDSPDGPPRFLKVVREGD